jgi:hypothetical protein
VYPARAAFLFSAILAPFSVCQQGIRFTGASSKPLLKYLSFLFKPLFSANHRWAMEQGRRGLQKEIDQRSQVAF